MSSPMTPEQARDDLEHLSDFEVGDVYNTCRHALETITNMTIEYGVKDNFGEIIWYPIDHYVGGSTESARGEAEEYAATSEFFTLVARLVSTEWEVKQ